MNATAIGGAGALGGAVAKPAVLATSVALPLAAVVGIGLLAWTAYKLVKPSDCADCDGCGGPQAVAGNSG